MELPVISHGPHASQVTFLSAEAGMKRSFDGPFSSTPIIASTCRACCRQQDVNDCFR